MRYGAILAESWRVTWRERRLWPLALIRGLQALVGVAFLLVLTVPVALLTVAVAPSGVSSTLAQDVARHVSGVAADLFPTYALISTLFFLVWVAAAVLDVAASGGLIGQVNAAEQGATPSAATGLTNGFRHWGRIAALLAITVMPALIALLVRSIAAWFAIGLPALRGAAPNLGAFYSSSIALSPLSGIAALIAIPLGALVELALRYGVVDDLEWKAAFGRAWALAKKNVGPTALMWLLIFAVTYGATLAVQIVLGLLVGVGVAFVVLSVLSHAVGVAWVVGTVAGLVLAVGGLAFASAIALFTSSVWTIFWRTATEVDLRFRNPAPEPAAPWQPQATTVRPEEAEA